MQPSISVNKTLQDNPLLLTSNTQKSSSNVLDATVALNRESARTKLTFTPRLNAVRYNNARELNADNRYLNLKLAHDYVYNNVLLNLDYARQTTLAYELEDTGLLQTHKWRNSWSLNPIWTQEVTPRMTTSIAFSENRVRYENAQATSLVDYRYSTVMTAYQYDPSENSQFAANFSARRLSALDAFTVNHTYDAKFSFQHAISETGELTLLLGTSRSQYTIKSADKNTQDGALAKFSISQDGVRSHSLMNIERSLQPSSYGVMLLRDEAKLDLFGAVFQKVQFGMTLRVLRDKPQGENLVGSVRDYTYGELRGIWGFTRRWSLTCRYAISTQQYSFDQEKRVNRLVEVQLSYRGDKLSLH